MKKIINLIILLSTTICFTQIRGNVTDMANQPLSLVSVYLENSITGTTTNDTGNYELAISKKGKHTVVYQFLGYKTIKKNINITSFPFILNIKLAEQEVALDKVVLSSKENPANAIIRNTIASKDKNTDKFEKYTADFYSRGLYKVKELPKEFLGNKIEDMGGGLDSTRSGIIYLSETISKISYQKKPKKFKEHIIASKVSGTDNGISFNQAKEVDFNFYENAFNLADVQMISPISNTAFVYYNYKLIGSFYDKNGKLINKIKLLPKRKNDRVFTGFIYIVEDDWAIYGTDVVVTGTQMNSPVVSSLHIKQNYNYSPENSAWVLVTQTIDFKAGIFGFNFNGRFSAAYSNHNFEPNFTKKSFTNEVLSFAENATKKDSLYWQKIRPFNLTLEETADYKLKDSIKVVRTSKKYLDSVDTESNKFTPLSVLLGYSYDNTYKKSTVNISSIFKDLNFNTVQGWNTSVGINYSKSINKKGEYFNIGTKANYGFSDKKIRPTANFFYKWNNFTKPILTASAGITTSQFNAKNPISKVGNTIGSLFYQRNYLKIYEKTFAKSTFSEQITNGIRLFSAIEYADRRPLFNTTDYVVFPRKNRDYVSNNPQEPANFKSSFASHQMWLLNLGATINFGQKYASYPNGRYNIESNKYPSLFVGYRKNLNVNNSQWSSDVIYSELTQNVVLNNWGEFKYRAKGGLFFKKKDIQFIDYAHFNGNRLFVTQKNNYLDSFYLLPYYQLSTNDKYGELHGEHHFKGALLNKIPMLNKLNLHLVTSLKGLFTANNTPYTEVAVGLDNIGFGKWRFLRVDFAQSNYNGRRENRIITAFKFNF